jgi:2-oxoglutarate ferredoxin oxidoreductase subunit gamma
MARTEIRISGLGGQGVILSGYILGRAAAIFDTKFATMTQSFGPEARGSACSCQVILSDDRVLYPYIRQPQIMVVMSQEAYDKFTPELAENGTLLIDSDLVKTDGRHGKAVTYGIPATRFAEELGRKIVLNIIMIGFFTSMTDIVKEDAVREAILQSIPKGTEELNLKAFKQGLEYGKELRAGMDSKGKAKGKAKSRPAAKKGKTAKASP